VLFQRSAGGLPLVVVGEFRLENAAKVFSFDAAPLQFGFDKLGLRGE